MAGVGISILSAVTATEDISQGRLTVLPWSEGMIEVATLMIWYKDRWLSPTLSAFMEVVQEMLKTRYETA